jgi:hypothetical protein
LSGRYDNSNCATIRKVTNIIPVVLKEADRMHNEAPGGSSVIKEDFLFTSEKYVGN